MATVRTAVTEPALYINPTTRETFVAQYRGTDSRLVFYNEWVEEMVTEGFHMLCYIAGQASIEQTIYKRVTYYNYTKSLQTQLNELKTKQGGEDGNS